MNYKSRRITLFIFANLLAFCTFRYLLDTEVSYTILILVVINLYSLLLSAINGFAKPTHWFLKNRFWINGALFGILLAIINTLQNNDNVVHLSFNLIIVKLLISMVLGMLIMGTINFWAYRKLQKNTTFIPNTDEIELLTDTAAFENEETVVKKGRLVLTNKRLCFIAEGENNTRFEFSDAQLDIALDKFFGIPTTLIISTNETKIRVPYPELWKSKIEEVFQK